MRYYVNMNRNYKNKDGTLIIKMIKFNNEIVAYNKSQTFIYNDNGIQEVDCDV